MLIVDRERGSADPPASAASWGGQMRALVTLIKRSLQSFGSDKCSALAAAIAYYTVFALLPLALFAVSILGFFVGGAAARQQVVDNVTRVIPLGDSGAQAFAHTLQGVNRSRGLLGLIGLAVTAWSASGLFSAIRSALDSVWDVDRPLPAIRARLRDFSLLLGFGGLMGLSVASTGLLAGAVHSGGGVLGLGLDATAPPFALLATGIASLVSFAAFMFLYRVAPHARLGWGDVWPAALIGAIFFEFGKNILAFYIIHLGSFNALTGSLGAAILFLVFVYYAAQVMLLAAEFAKHRMLVRAGVLSPTDEHRQSPQVSPGDRLKGTLVRLWKTGEPHHEYTLPYAPGRIEPRTGRPTNTRDEVLFRAREARRQAERDAGGH